MSDDEESGLKKRGKKSFWNSGKVLILAGLVFVFIAGTLVEHYYIEPLLAPQIYDQLSSCQQSNQLLNLENQNCLEQLHDKTSTPSIDTNNPN